MARVVTFKTKGDFKKTMKFLKFLSSKAFYHTLEHYAKKGIVALAESTPKDSGVSSDSWGYNIDIGPEACTITWTNSRVADSGTPIVILVQYGHATRNGGWVEGIDFINPAIQPIFDDMARAIWKEVQDNG